MNMCISCCVFFACFYSRRNFGIKIIKINVHIQTNSFSLDFGELTFCNLNLPKEGKVFQFYVALCVCHTFTKRQIFLKRYFLSASGVITTFSHAFYVVNLVFNKIYFSLKIYWRFCYIKL